MKEQNDAVLMTLGPSIIAAEVARFRYVHERPLQRYSGAVAKPLC
jgi:hypothetical protein